ncbi:protein unc-13 homolog 4B isoform X2 [Scaptodrosophila lebanonensis]|uniref:Protein unc-13 homolog 4B isoform X2 n=1 Tax=Drosophila lebanonensis TaxID=7225 RepID=A0A6J2SZM6_DROLE|nr:protein unc-13 homolog 4B isoform X2 [Scaptodrosophila lebanonensis]
MDEEQMWKGFFEKLQELKMNPPTEHEHQLQVSDDGFFENFGSLLRQRSQLEENVLKTTLAPFQNEEEEDGTDNVENSELGEITIGSDCSSIEFFSEPTVQNEASAEREKEQLFEKSIGMNVEDLYEEIIFEICNNIGSESNEMCPKNLIEFSQEAFKIPNVIHDEVLKVVRQKQPPNIRLNVEIIKAENLLPKDSNGLSDPFVTLYLESNSSHRYNSSVKPATLNPIWEEHFSLPIVDNPKEEVLVVEVWDFDAAETVKEKVNKFLDVKGVKGLSKLMKEIAVTASSGKHDNELIGRAVITLKSIPVSGLTVWYNLEKGNKTKSRGSLLINLTLSAEKNKSVAVQEHKHLLKLLLIHELETSQVANFWWSGNFSANAEAIRSQHAVQSGLSSFDCALCQWNAYIIIVPVIRCYQSNCEDVKTFWDGAKRLLPSCFLMLRKLRCKNESDKNIVRTLNVVLDILSKLKSLEPPAEVTIFPKSVYGWIDEIGSVDEYSIESVIIDAINTGTKEWLEHIISGSRQTKDNETDEDKLQYIIKLIQMVRSDLQRAMEYFDKLFYHKIRLNYSAILFMCYDKKLTEISKSTLQIVCGNIQKLDVPDDQFQYLPNTDNVQMGTTLFEVYLVLKRYVALGESLCSNEKLEMTEYYQWFEKGVTHWLDISIIKALNRIQKAIDLDQLKAVDETVKYSSSAVDTLAIFYQIKIFWQQLDWPEVEGAYTFVAKIVNDICRCCIFYAQRMSRRVEDITKVGDSCELFNVSEEWCLAINNIDYIRQSLPSFIKELGTEDIIKRLGEYRTILEADRCASTINTVIENALDIQRNQIVELVEIVAGKMAPPIRRFLAEGAEILHKDSNSMDKLMMYLEGSLGTLYRTLNDVNFGRILDGIWSELSKIMYDLIQSNLDKRRPPAFFQNLRATLQTMISCFKIGRIVTSDVKVLSAIEKILDLHAFETSDLIHQYYLERLGAQKELQKSQYGQLTITAQFGEGRLKLQILNARNLVPMDTNGSCDSFVKAQFLPTTRFNGVLPVKTSVKNKTRFPLYDEQFSITLSEEQLSKQNSIILFSIKDKDLFGMTSQYIAECYVTFADLMAFENEQIHMELSRPDYTDSETLRALEYRQGDKQAKEFIKKLRNKSYS